MNDRYSRQSFLGEDSQRVLAGFTVGIVGASGGGSHIGQHTAHIGFGIRHIIDPDICEEHHRHRLVGITSAAVKRGWHKVKVAARLARHVHPEGRIFTHPHRWQDVHEVLRTCHLVFSCLDDYSQREELERYLRRFHVPMIDIGMDVALHEHGHSIVGQVILSMPGSHCMRCFGFIRDELLQLEAGRYGDAGPRAQVIWPNGTLASTAMGVAMSVLLPWHRQLSVAPYLLYNGNTMEIAASPRLQHLEGIGCPHYGAMAGAGDPCFGLPTVQIEAAIAS